MRIVQSDSGGSTNERPERRLAVQPVAAERRVAAVAPAPTLPPRPTPRPSVRGKFLFIDGEKLYVRGVTYGAFKPDAEGGEFHDLRQIDRDFTQMVAYGINTV